MLTRFAPPALAVMLAGHFLMGASVVPVRVAVPLGMTAGFPSTTQATNGTVYVTVGSVSARNPSGTDVQFYDARDFRLLVDERVYTPVVRPGLGGLDFSGSGMLRPNESLTVTVTFEVPAGTTSASLGFLPHWFDDHGASVVFCCYYP